MINYLCFYKGVVDVFMNHGLTCTVTCMEQTEPVKQTLELLPFFPYSKDMNFHALKYFQD